MTNLISSVDDSNFAYHVLRYTPDLVAMSGSISE